MSWVSPADCKANHGTDERSSMRKWRPHSWLGTCQLLHWQTTWWTDDSVYCIFKRNVWPRGQIGAARGEQEPQPTISRIKTVEVQFMMTQTLRRGPRIQVLWCRTVSDELHVRHGEPYYPMKTRWEYLQKGPKQPPFHEDQDIASHLDRTTDWRCTSSSPLYSINLVWASWTWN